MSTAENKRGRRKIVMAKMTKESNLMVTFSKRRIGLFKKASEIATLCGAEVAIVVFSPCKTVYSFGHPNVETIIDRFLCRDSPSISVSNNVASHRNATIQALNSQLEEARGTFGGVKKETERLKQMNKSATKGWWESPIETLGADQLYTMKTGLEELQANIQRKLENMLASQGAVTSIHQYPNPNNNPDTTNRIVGLENNNQAMYDNNGQEASGFSSRPF